MRRIEGRPRDDAGRRLYWVWSAMIQRCHNPRSRGYKTYGATGITVCDRWRRSFDDFYQDMGFAPAGHSIERLDSTSGYSKDNCVWATRTEQNRNRPNWCLYLRGIDGNKVPLRAIWEGAAHSSVSYRNFRKRLRLRNWSLIEALCIPERGHRDLHGYRRTAR